MGYQGDPGTGRDCPSSIDFTDESLLDDDLSSFSTETKWVVIDSLLPADSPRLEGEDLEYIRMLAETDAKLPPVIVHRATMRIIDGMHRVGAARMRGSEKIDVRFFDGSEQEAFVLGVRANVSHGRPLSLVDRTSAAMRIIRTHPMWSDRAIAAAVGLGARTVGTIRRQLDTESGHVPLARMGRDGRVRPLNNVEGRRRASEIIKEMPTASLREIAKHAGVSPTTALDVRKRLERGEDPVPQVRRGPAGVKARTATQAARAVAQQDLSVVLRGLERDPSLRHTESGRDLLRWIFSRTILPGEWRAILNDLPSHCTYIIADVAKRCADEWLRVVEELEKRPEQASEPNEQPERPRIPRSRNGN
jgi:hypothetical protein